MLDQSSCSERGNADVSGSFANPVFEAQATFKAVMDAMARPGSCQPVDTSTIDANGVNSTVAALILTLCDVDTSVWLTPNLDPDALGAWIEFHTGAQFCKRSAEAQFAICDSSTDMPPLNSFMQGTQNYPDRSTTLIVQCQSLLDGPDVVLSGSGISGEKKLTLPAVPDVFIEVWQANRALFPRGVDVIFAGVDSVMCLPRSARMHGANEELEA